MKLDNAWIEWRFKRDLLRQFGAAPDEDGYITPIEGRVYWYPPETHGEEEAEIGRIDLSRIELTRWVDDGERVPIVNIMDETELLSRFMVAMLELSEDDPGGNWLLIERVELKPEFRGQGIGAAVVREAIEMFTSSPLDIVAGIPFPLQWEGRGDEDPKALEADRQKLIAYWEQWGCTRVGDSEVWATDRERRIPRVDEVRS